MKKSTMRAMGQLIRSILCAGVIVSISTGCNSWIYDDLSGCPNELVFQFYRQSPCETQPYYPNNIREVRVFAFNKEQVLTEQYSISNVTLRGDYHFATTISQQGDYSFVAWGAESFDDYHFSQYQKGVTTRSELLLALQRQGSNSDGKLKPLYFSQLFKPVCLCYPEGAGTHRDTVALNMQELTNRVNLTVYGLAANKEYRIFIEDNNDVYDFNGQIVEGRPTFEYLSPQDLNSTVYRCRFTTLKLEEHRGTRLVIYDETEEKEVFSTLLVDELIMYRGIFGEPPYSLECDHDFNVLVWLEPSAVGTGTYMAVQAVVNDWNVVKQVVTPY